jgi:hypothetical protein
MANCLQCGGPNGALCEALKKHLHHRLWELWNGTNVDPWTAEQFRHSLLKHAGLSSVPAGLEPGGRPSGQSGACQCGGPNAGLCAALKRHIRGRLWELWNGVNVAPAMAEGFRQRLLKRAGLSSVPAGLEPRTPLEVLPLEPRCLWLSDKRADTYHCACGGGGHVELWNCERYGRCVPQVVADLVTHPNNHEPLPAQCWQLSETGATVPRCPDYEPRKPIHSILITGGIGDLLTVESFMPAAMRKRLETVYYACPSWETVAQLLPALPNFPRLSKHVILTKDRRTYYSYGEVARVTGPFDTRDDWSVGRIFGMVQAGALTYTGSSFLCHQVAEPPELPRPYVVVCPSSSWGYWPGRSFDAADWRQCTDYLDRRKIHGVVLTGHIAEMPSHARLVDLRGKATILEAIEVVKGAVGYLGICSWPSVLATKLWPTSVAVKSTGAFLHHWKHVYYAPRTEFGFIQPRLVAPED